MYNELNLALSFTIAFTVIYGACGIHRIANSFRTLLRWESEARNARQKEEEDNNYEPR